MNESEARQAMAATARRPQFSLLAAAIMMILAALLIGAVVQVWQLRVENENLKRTLIKMEQEKSMLEYTIAKYKTL